jgi:hypothetical protein
MHTGSNTYQKGLNQALGAFNPFYNSMDNYNAEKQIIFSAFRSKSTLNII